jgi:hypothetical protein
VRLERLNALNDTAEEGIRTDTSRAPTVWWANIFIDPRAARCSAWR